MNTPSSLVYQNSEAPEVSAVSGAFPLLAYELRSKDQINGMLTELSKLAAPDTQASALWGSLEALFYTPRFFPHLMN